MKSIQVFEHQTLKIGTSQNSITFELRHFKQFKAQGKSKYYQIVHEGIRFKQYVGAIQCDDLTIEILPKTDQYNQSPTLWRNFLIDMLHYCKWLRLDTSSVAQLSLRSNNILELYYEIFLDELKKIMDRGLYKSYTTTAGNRKSVKGSIQFEKHLSQNYIHKERFYVKHTQYDFNHPLNQVLFQALQILKQAKLSNWQRNKLHEVLAIFPNLSDPIVELDRLTFNSQNAHYLTAIDIARLILQNKGASLRTGKQKLITLLFDMNLLFEAYIYEQLRKAGATARRQQQVPFWNRRTIRPDIILNCQEQTVIIDTKWKVLHRVHPAMSDIQQAYVYSQYFDAKQCVLLYPKVYETTNFPPTPFQSHHSQTAYYCTIHFAEVLKDERLNRQIGKELLEAINKSILNL